MVSSLHDCNILCITETHLSPDITDAEIFIENFKIFRGDRNDGRDKGGSAIYVHNNIPCVRIDCFNPNDSLAVLIDLPNFQLAIACVYRSQSISHEDNLSMISQIKNLKSVIPSDAELMVVGDFNLPNVCWDTGTVICPTQTRNKHFGIQKKFVDMFLDEGLFWHLPDGTTTRRRMYNGVLQESHLDQILTTDPAILLNFEIVAGVGKSDHLGVVNRLKCASIPGYIRSEKKIWSKMPFESIAEFGKEYSWDTVGTEQTVEELWERIVHRFNEISDHVPTTYIKISANGMVHMRPPWDCTALKRSRKAKEKSWETFDSTPTYENLAYAIEKSNDFDNTLKKSMTRYERKMTRGMKRNPKAFYSYMNSKRKIKQTVVSVKSKTGHLAKSPKETANILAEFFESTFVDPKSTLDIGAQYAQEVINTAKLEPVSLEEVGKLLKNINIFKSMGPDGIHPKLLKALSENTDFVNNVQLLFNTCLEECKIPKVWKQANITPIHKKGSVNDAKNYRPISLTSVMGKLFEKVVRDRILNEVGDKICHNQHGFMSKKSCLSNLLEAVDYINDVISNEECADVFYLDFQKAFDTVPHHKLMIKLKNMGLSNRLLAIISDFLINREFRVIIGDSASDPRPVHSGVPQGSVLGPLLFVLYINDIQCEIHNLLMMFADDVKLCASTSQPHVIQGDLDKLEQWQKSWGLTFNTVDSKCKVMHIGRDNPCHKYYINGIELPSTAEEKDLGVWITSDFTWQLQIDKCIKKAKSTMAWISRVIIVKEKDTMLQLYKTMVRPHLEYCVQLWSPQPRHGNWESIMKIEDVQRQFTRQINGMGALSYKERLKELGLTTLLERRARGDLIETFKILNGFTNYGDQLFRTSRSGYNILHPVGKRSNRQNDFLNTRVIEYWNKLPHSVKNSTSVEMFKSKLEAYKQSCLVNTQLGIISNYWELSDMLLIKINDDNRIDHINFLLSNPDIARHNNINLYGL